MQTALLSAPLAVERARIDDMRCCESNAPRAGRAVIKVQAHALQLVRFGKGWAHVCCTTPSAEGSMPRVRLHNTVLNNTQVLAAQTFTAHKQATHTTSSLSSQVPAAPQAVCAVPFALHSTAADRSADCSPKGPGSPSNWVQSSSSKELGPTSGVGEVGETRYQGLPAKACLQTALQAIHWGGV
jgi:hypothetical protein